MVFPITTNMKLKKVALLVALCFAFVAGFAQSDKTSKYINPEGFTVGARFDITKAGANYYRKSVVNGTFEYYLLNLPLKPASYKTHFANGEEKSFDVQLGVLDLPMIPEGYHQSSGNIIRLRAEYLYNSKLYGRIHFNFINGFVCSYAKWAAGFRVNNANNGWEHSAELDYSRETFKKYLDKVLKNTTVSSLSREMVKVGIRDVRPGDVLIQTGHNGHAVIILDVLYNTVDNTVKLVLAQGFTPAQEMEILKNYEDDESPWFTVSLDSNDETMIRTPQWTFYVKDLRRFGN